MPRSRWLTEDEGSASLEFITVGLLMLVPLVYLVLTVASIQSAALAAEGAARQAARVFVLGETDAEAREMAIRAVEFALADHGVPADSFQLAITCAPRPATCLSRGGFVTVEISVVAALPLAPPFLTTAFGAGVPLQATATQRVSRFWGSG